jgi:hypothetical protein
MERSVSGEAVKGESCMARFDGGWIKLWRKTLESDIFDNVYLWATWHALLYMATWKPSKILWNGKQREIPPGSVVFSPREIADRFDCSKSVVLKWLRYLHDTQRIVIETSPAGTLVTIQKWELYQGRDEEACAPSEHGDDTATTPRVHDETLSKEGKKGRKKAPIRGDYPEDFQEIYNLYPRKEGKSDGFVVYQRAIKTDEDRENLKTAIERYAKAKAGTEIQYLRGFDRFMRTWTDWLDPNAGKGGVAAAAPKPLKTVADLDAEEAGAGHA